MINELKLHDELMKNISISHMTTLN